MIDNSGEKNKIIDIHGHFGECNNHNKNLNDLLMSGNIEVVRERALQNKIVMTFVSSLKSLMPYGGDVLEGNIDALTESKKYSDIKFWCVYNPRIKESKEQVKQLLNEKNMVGIKIHPTFHKYDILDYGDEIFKFALDYKLIILTHSGCETPPEDVAIFANKYKKVKIILAHLGNSANGDLSRQVESFKRAKSENLYIDTSSGCSIYSGLIEWAVDSIGSQNILFGSDTPLHFTSCQKIRIEHAKLTDKDKYNIFIGNAERLFDYKLNI